MSKTILDVHFTMHIADRVITLVDIGAGFDHQRRRPCHRRTGAWLASRKPAAIVGVRSGLVAASVAGLIISRW
jgi:hypothetical protein